MTGRPKGSLACEWMGGATGPFCRQGAKVEVVVRLKNAQGTGFTEYTQLRCLEHYVELENVARKSANLDVVDAKLFEPSG